MQKTKLLLLVNFLLVVVIVALIAQQYFSNPSSSDTQRNSNPVNTGASTIDFTSWELQTWFGIKNRVSIINTDPDFPDPNPDNRILGWYSMRNSSSGDYYQKSMEFLCFWEGQGANGEWEAVVSIYNAPNSKSDFVVEVSRFTWHSLEVILDNKTIAEFPQITKDTVSTGYTSFHVIPL